jgi:hypothetical protein
MGDLQWSISLSGPISETRTPYRRLTSGIHRRARGPIVEENDSPDAAETSHSLSIDHRLPIYVMTRWQNRSSRRCQVAEDPYFNPVFEELIPSPLIAART